MVGMNKTTIIAVISDDSVLKCERRRQFTSDLLRSTLPLLAVAFTGPWPNYFSNVRHGREIERNTVFSYFSVFFGMGAEQNLRT